MPARSTRQDKYSNILDLNITMSAADTLTFEEIDIGLTLFDKVGLLMARWEFEVSAATSNELQASADELDIAITQSNQITALSLDQNAIVDKIKLKGHSSGAPATLLVLEQPWKKDYTGLPGGGILVAPRPLYIGMNTSGFAAAGYAAIRFYFTIVSLKDAEYFELLESRRFFG